MLELCTGLKESMSMDYLDLRQNIFDQKGLAALIQSLKEHMSVKHLALEGMRFDHAEAEMLARMKMEQERKKQERDKATMLEEQQELVEAHQAEQQALEARSAEAIFNRAYNDQTGTEYTVGCSYLQVSKARLPSLVLPLGFCLRRCLSLLVPAGLPRDDRRPVEPGEEEPAGA